MMNSPAHGTKRIPQPLAVSCQGSVWTLPILLAATLGIPSWFLFLLVLGCFRSEGFSSHIGSATDVNCGGKSHLGISGSKAACAYPEHIAACHALLQRPSRAIRQAAYHAMPLGTHA